MPFQINNAELDARLEALADRQPFRLSRAALVEAILWSALRAAEASEDPLAWRHPREPRTQENGTTAV